MLAKAPRRFHLLDGQRMATKAALAVGLAVGAASVLRNEDPLSAAFVALVCVAPSAARGLRRGLEQVAASAVGAAVGTLFLAFSPDPRSSIFFAVAVAPAVLASLTLCLRVLAGPAYLTAGFSTLYVMLMPFSTGVDGFRIRLTAVVCGALAATLTNTFAASLFSASVVHRRRAIVRSTVAEAVRARAQNFSGVLEIDAANAAHDDASEVLAEARGDFRDAAEEAFFPGAHASRAEAAAALAEARILAELLQITACFAYIEAGPGTRFSWANVLNAVAEWVMGSERNDGANAAIDEGVLAEQNGAAAAQGRLLKSCVERLGLFSGEVKCRSKFDSPSC